ncbi:hypothetical protein MRX96_041160 [Rhipicephalus microplus]
MERSGCPKATTEEENPLITAAIMADPFQSAEDIREAVLFTIMSEIVKRRLSEMGLQRFVAAQKPCLLDSQLRIDFTALVDVTATDRCYSNESVDNGKLGRSRFSE